MLKHPEYTRTRIQQLVARLGEKIYAERRPVDELVVAGPVGRLSYKEAQALKPFRRAAIGDQFRPLWSTYWFRGNAKVPADWKGARVDLLWDSQSEATLWLDGVSAQGLNMTQGDRPDAILKARCKGGETLPFEIELACNVKFGTPSTGFPSGKEPVSPFVLRRCEIARFNPLAWDLYWDAYVLAKLEADLAKEGASGDLSWAGLLLAELNRFCNVINPDDPTTWESARSILRALYDHRTAGRVFELSVIGHAHIDTAWLWPLAETHRKCERTFSSATAYMRDYPEYRFACSQAYQYDAIRSRNPALYARIKEAVLRGQFVPVGGTWVEPDCNIPSGESLCRQFLFGQRFFEREFGRRCREFWNPDVFGYNGQLPQILSAAGISRFLTQKLSWNRFNKPVNHTFLWQGIDGTQVLTHFPPADTYNAMAGSQNEVASLRFNMTNFRDHDRAHEACMLYGFGDGGGGPTKPMLEVIRRAADLQGLPRTVQRSSDEFFERLERDLQDRPVLVGELYFEYHRGTYTSQAAVKRNNREAEHLLHDLEFLAVATGATGTRETINTLWRTLLLNQFHDILPGSSIREVYEDSARQFADLFKGGEALARRLAGKGKRPINTLGVPRREVVEHEGQLQMIEAAPFSAGTTVEPCDTVQVKKEKSRFILENGFLRAVLTTGGRLVSLVHKASGRESLQGEGNVLELYEDRPTNYDAWDADPFHLETGRACEPAQQAEIIRRDALRAEIRFVHSIGAASTLTQRVRLDAGSARLEFHNEADWQEASRFLKVAVPVLVHAEDATYEMQFGHVARPTHYTTPYDLARYEVPMHRWFDMSEHGFGVAILNDCKYGGSVYGHTMRLSLLRAPKSPDPTCDVGMHRFAWALMPHAGNWRGAGVVAEALRFNQPVRWGDGAPVESPLAYVEDRNVVLDTIKETEESDGVILRLYECHGGRGTAELALGRPYRTACRCNVLEDEGEALPIENGRLRLAYRPHEIISIKLRA